MTTPTPQLLPLPFNGRAGAIVRWLIGMALAATVAYFTAQAKTQTAIAVLEKGQQDLSEQFKREIDQLREDQRVQAAQLRDDIRALAARPGIGR